MATVPFPPFNLQDLALAGLLWESYATSLSTNLTKLYTAVDGITIWEGDRADRFYQWWDPANQDIAVLSQVAGTVARAIAEYTKRASTINITIDELNREVTSKAWCSGGNRWIYDVPKDAAGDLQPYAGEAVQLDIVNYQVTVFAAGGLPTDAWPNQLQTKAIGLLRSIGSASLASAATIKEAQQDIKSLQQITGFHRGSKVIGSTGVDSDNDPVWKQLTGGDLFKPVLPPGFSGDPFSDSDVPDWYQPTTTQKVEHWVGEHAADIVLGLSFAADLSGNAEVGTPLAVVAGLINTAKAIDDGDLKDAAIDGLSTFLSAAKAPDAIAGLFTTDEMTKAVSGQILDYVKEQVADKLKGREGDDLTVQELEEILHDTQAYVDGTSSSIPPTSSVSHGRMRAD